MSQNRAPSFGVAPHDRHSAVAGAWASAADPAASSDCLIRQAYGSSRRGMGKCDDIDAGDADVCPAETVPASSLTSRSTIVDEFGVALAAMLAVRGLEFATWLSEHRGKSSSTPLLRRSSTYSPTSRPCRHGRRSISISSTALNAGEIAVVHYCARRAARERRLTVTTSRKEGKKCPNWSRHPPPCAGLS